MRDPKRIVKICKLLEKVWAQDSDLRLGQLLTNLARITNPDRVNLFYLEDDEMEDLLRRFVKNRSWQK